LAEAQKYLPPNCVVASNPGKGQIAQADFDSYNLKRSRDFDDDFAPKGFEVPFPDLAAAVAGNTVQPPRKAIDITTYFVVSDVRAQLNFGNRRARDVSKYEGDAEAARAELMAQPKLIGYGLVLTPESLTTKLSISQYGRTIQPLYRLANRNVDPDSVYFCDASGKEVFRPELMPFSLDLGDYDMLEPAEGLIYLLNESMILAQTAGGGGVKYRFSWRKLDWGQAHPTRYRGVSYL
jgi:hypothetical protein